MLDGCVGSKAMKIKERLIDVQDRVRQAATRVGRSAEQIRIMAVTKNQPRQIVEMAVTSGICLIGENRVQEAASKLIPVIPNIESHLIGHLQRNKVRAATDLFHNVQSIDKVATAEALQRVLAQTDKTMDILIELNTSGENNKYGFSNSDELLYAFEEIIKLDRLRVRGLMTMAIRSKESEVVRACFQTLRILFDELSKDRPDFNTLSMGMSEDFEIAVEEGATLLRLGRVLFAPQDDSFFGNYN